MGYRSFEGYDIMKELDFNINIKLLCVFFVTWQGSLKNVKKTDENPRWRRGDAVISQLFLVSQL